jgi:tRNA nucleotidyltransferase/poly(A) polymerase
MTIQVYEVGGCVRDGFLGLTAKDVDLLLVGAQSFEEGVEHARSLGLNPIPGTFRPEFATFKAAVPKKHKLRERCKAVDFVLSRKDGFHTDGRRPDSTSPGTLEDDLRRRDFTVNALAKNLDTGEIVDLFNGKQDLEDMVLRFVGDPMTRIREDGLRVMRGFRFAVTKGFILGQETRAALVAKESAEMLSKVSIERVREELESMFRKDTLGSLRLLETLPGDLKLAIFRNGLRLSATLKAL